MTAQLQLEIWQNVNIYSEAKQWNKLNAKSIQNGLNLISIKKGELCHFILKNNHIELLITEEQ